MTESEKISYNCRKATFLIEKKQTGKITAGEGIELKIHLAGCSICRNFQKQSLLIRQLLKTVFHARANRNVRLDEDFKTELQHTIEKILNKS